MFPESEVAEMNLTPKLQADLVAGMRAAVPKICGFCKGRIKIDRFGWHYWDQGGLPCGTRCKAISELALLARADAELAAQAAERKA